MFPFFRTCNTDFILKLKLCVVRVFKYESNLCKNCFVGRLHKVEPYNIRFYKSEPKINLLVYHRNYVSYRNFCTNVGKGKAVPIRKLNKSHIERLLSLAKPERGKLTVAVGLLLISSVVTMAVPFSLGKVLDIIYTSTSDMESSRVKLNNVCLILCGIFLLGGLCNFGRVYLMAISGQRMTQSLRKKLFSSIINQEAGWFDSVSTGQLVNRLSADTQLVGATLSSNISDGLRSLFMISAGTGMMFYMSTELALVGLSVVPPIAGIAILYGRFVRKITTELQDRLAEATHIAEEKISNIRTVKIFNKEISEANEYSTKIESVLKLAYKESLARGVFYGMTGLSGNIIIISVLYYGGVMVSSQNITVGNLTSFLLYAAYIGVSLGGLSSFYSELNKGIGAATRLWEIIDRPPAISFKGHLIPSEIPKGEILFENVKFSYPTRSERNVLENFNLKIEPGKSLAVVGGSGCGKTTIALLLLRLYEPNSGVIKIDGQNIKDINIGWLRKHIGAVNQEPVLFAMSIKDNILYGLNDSTFLSDEQFYDTTRMACIDEFVQNLPHGYDTYIGERGITLSGGQRQRIAIARAIIKNPKIIILDEATSALDPYSEHLVREALKNVSQNRTVLTIAHRLSTIQASDTIAVLQNGLIVEQGSYNELINIDNGYFRELIHHQMFQDVK